MRGHHRASTLSLLIIISLAFVVRMVGIDWDDGRYLHPDERHIVADVLVGRVEFTWPPTSAWLDPETSPLNPRPMHEDGTYAGFAYGTLPVYVVDLLGNAGHKMTGDDWGDYAHAAYIGRALSILLDTATTLLAYLIGSRLAGRAVGLVAAAIYGFLPVAIQASHFFIVDSWMTFFIFASLYTMMRAVESRSIWQFPIAAAWFAAALASKTTAAPLAGIIVLGMFLVALSEASTVVSMLSVIGRLALRVASSLIAFLAVYFIGEPFAFLAPEALLDSIRTQTDIQSGRWDVPFTEQYVGTARGAYQLVEATRYFMGPVAALIGLAGAALLGWHALRGRSQAAALLLVWIAGFTVVVLVPETKWPRYTLPLAPALAVAAALAIVALATVLRTRAGKPLAVAFVAVLLVISGGYGAAFANVTTNEHTRISASVWMTENLPPGSTTTSEIWDDRLPLALGAGNGGEIRRLGDASINLYSGTPTLGDLSRLGPALGYLPNGNRIASAIGAGDVDEAVHLLRSVGPASMASTILGDGMARGRIAISPDSSPTSMPTAYNRTALFQTELMRAVSGMTSSPSVVQTVQETAQHIALENVVTIADIRSIADAVELAGSTAMIEQVYHLLSTADYYVLASDRVERGMDQNPWRHAVQVRMYELLASGELGYEPVRTFQASPSLFGVDFPDAGADETFINYDHPVVRIYKKTGLVPHDRFVELFGSAAMAQSQPGRDPDSEPLTFDTPVSDLQAVDDYRWSETLTGNSWGAAIVWIVMLIALQIAAWPLARAVFRVFPDGGWGLARLVGTIVPATVLWWLASVRVLSFRSAWVVAGMLLFALASWLWFGRSRLTSPRLDRRAILAAEAVFWVTFLVFLVFKMINPDSWHLYWGGEKPMEFAQINAILRSAHFPPVDPWYAQGYINYYYYSFYLVAFLIKLTGIPTEIAFNLAQPMIMGVLASSTFSVGALLGNRLTRGRQSGLVSGLIAFLLVSFAGNMMGAAQVIADLQGETGAVDGFSHWVWAPSRAIAYTITEFPYFTGLYGDLHSHVIGMTLVVLAIALAAALAFDAPRRGAMASRHGIGLILVASVTLGIVYPTNAWDLPVSAALIAGGLVIGTAAIRSVAQRAVHVVGIAVAVALGAVAISLPFMLHFEALFGSVESVRTVTTLLELESHVGGILLVASAAVPVLFGIATGSRRPAIHVALLFGLAVVLALRWLASEGAPGLVRGLDIVTVLIVAAIWLWPVGTGNRRARFDGGLPGVTGPALAALGAIATVALIASDRLVAALYVALAVASAAMWLRRRPRGVRFLALLVTGGAGIGAGVEIVYLVDDLSTTDWARMNTVFKFYNQIWLLLAISAGTAAGVLVASSLGRLGTAQGSWRFMPREGGKLARPPATLVTAVVLTLSVAYPIAATGARLDTRFEPREGGLTLNAYAWMDYATVPLTNGETISFDEDRDVIDWFNHEVSGTPVIAEAAFAPYRCNSSRISIGTGLPSVLGWQRHEMQQRYGEVLPPRDADLRTLYASRSVEEKLAILNRYDVHYVVVGELERVYPVVSGNDCVPMEDAPEFRGTDLDAGIATFEEMTGDTLEVAFRSGDTVVYRVVGNT